ncbi:hypothetical protein [Sulfurimonas autotrophica]|uniref:Uncharacterized protein n=1 Tax=Sulfurimonas autotrophica (strain ATCC BAA-671 / DSM 16294 / JCM 11897 / OK10) TaxID=563040 RepID=E0UU45_SULAO|nr:hypothetical protein [Sulfurimonas autotrophica]ADN08354.1 hypothetical protein Saut_0305 [Sulfurimonas autotrophica DSM 16294]
MDEKPDMLLIVSKAESSSNLNLAPLLEALPQTYEGIANRLSPSMHGWPIITEVEKAISLIQLPKPKTNKCKVAREPSQESKEVVLKRRSIHVMDKEKSMITKEQFHTLLKSIDCSLDGKENAIHLAIFLHREKSILRGST